jgi:hypothetical protein
VKTSAVCDRFRSTALRANFPHSTGASQDSVRRMRHSSAGLLLLSDCPKHTVYEAGGHMQFFHNL